MLTGQPDIVALLAAIWILPLVVAAICRIVRARGLGTPVLIDAALRSTVAPVVLGAVSGAITLFVWGSLREPGWLSDEHAYKLQAAIFASGRWTGVPPPVPAFFEQMQVFVEPTLAAKYPPGHSFLLIPGMWLGLPGLVPLLLVAVSGGLIYALARRVADGFVALLTWALWSTSYAGLFWNASYLSQNTSRVIWLCALASLLSWREGKGNRHLVAVAALLAAFHLTRPFTAVALAVPIVWIVLRRAWAARAFAPVVIASGVGASVLALNLIWQKQVLGDWRVSPYAEWSRQYLPFDKPGFGVDQTPPTRTVPPEIAWVGQQFIGAHVGYSPSALPTAFLDRTTRLLFTLGEGWRGLFIVLAIVGAYRARGPAQFAAVSMLSLLAGYLIFAHASVWVVYYAEVFPVFFFLASVEIVRLVRGVRRLREPQVGLVCVAALLVTAPLQIGDVLRARAENDRHTEFYRRAERVLATIPDRQAIVFIRYAPEHRHHFPLIFNTPDYRLARLWQVYDRGDQNQRLLNVSNRPAYRLVTGTWAIEKIR